MLSSTVSGGRPLAPNSDQGVPPQGPGPNDRGLSRVHLARALEASLRRLGTDYIDLYQCHQWDPATPIEETMAALDAFVRSGKVRYLGCSNFTAAQPGVTAVIAGPRTLGQLHDNLEGLSLVLPPDALARLSDISRPASPEPVTGLGALH